MGHKGHHKVEDTGKNEQGLYMSVVNSRNQSQIVLSYVQGESQIPSGAFAQISPHILY